MIHLPNPVHQAEGIYKRGQKLSNAITKFWNMPCAGNGMIFFEAAAAGVWDFVWALESPDIRHQITQGTGRSALCHLKGVINATGVASGPTSAPVKSGLYHLAAKVDISTWWGFLAAAGEDGLIDFFSTAIRLSGCAKMSKGGAVGFGNHCIAGGSHTDGWHSGPVWRMADWPTTPDAPNVWHLDPGETVAYSGTYSIWGSTGIQPLFFETRIINTTLGGFHVFAPPEGNLIEGFTQSFAQEITNTSEFTCTYELQTRVPADQVYLTWLSNGIGNGFWTKHPSGWIDKGDRNPANYQSKVVRTGF